MSEPARQDDPRELEPVHTGGGAQSTEIWTLRLVLFLRVMAAVSLLKGLYHWSRVVGIMVEPGQGFETHSIAWQASTVFFAVIDLVAAVGLWQLLAGGPARAAATGPHDGSPPFYFGQTRVWDYI